MKIPSLLSFNQVRLTGRLEEILQVEVFGWEAGIRTLISRVRVLISSTSIA